MEARALENLLISLGIQQVTQRNQNILALCPNHSETRPSWGISIHDPHWHGCFGCGFKGNLVSLLRHYDWTNARIQKFASLHDTVSTVDMSLDSQERFTADEQKLLSIYYRYSLPKKIAAYVSRWRQLKVTTLYKAQMLYDSQQHRVLFPWFIGGRLTALTGRILPKYESKETGKTLPYGNSVKGQSLYVPFGHSFSMFKKWILVEGEFSALKLANYGFFNVAATGFGNFTKAQCSLLYRAGVGELICFFDNDKRGNDLYHNVEKLGSISFKITKVNYDKFNLPVSIDPADLTREGLQQLIKSRFDPTFVF